MAYIYDDADNVPMTDENYYEERHCTACQHYDGKFCTTWDCHFVLKQETKNCHERCPYSKLCYEKFQCKGSHDPSYPFECAIFDKILDHVMEAEHIPFYDPEDMPEGDETDEFDS